VGQLVTTAAISLVQYTRFLTSRNYCCSFGLVGQLVTTAAITRYLLIPVAPMLWMYCKITAVYLETSRELQARMR
jgi:hypothetical protein